jgi:hypothetical protein
MNHRPRSWFSKAGTVVAIVATLGTLVTIHDVGVANADVCVSAGRGERLRQPRRRDGALRAAAGLLRTHARGLRTATAAAPWRERQRVRRRERAPRQRERLQLTMTVKARS